MTEIMPVPRNLNFTVLPAESFASLLFFLEEKKQKKTIFGTAALPRFCGYHKRTAQNGRFLCEPSVFHIIRPTCGGTSFLRRLPRRCLSFHFFKENNVSPSFLFMQSLERQRIARRKRDRMSVLHRACRSRVPISTPPYRCHRAFP